MSAYLVEKNHVLFLAAAARKFDTYVYHSGASVRYDRNTSDLHVAALATELWKENQKSVNYRYTESDTVEEITAADVRANVWSKIDPAQVFKAIDCYEYQACEHPEWDDSFARHFCEYLRRRAGAKLAGYDDAAWGAPKTDAVLREEFRAATRVA